LAAGLRFFRGGDAAIRNLSFLKKVDAIKSHNRYNRPL